MAYIDPLIPLNETSEKSLTRFSVEIGTLTGLMNAAEQGGQHYLATMFNRARDAKVAQAEEIIVRMNGGGEELADDRRFLLVRDPASIDVVSVLPNRRSVRPPIPLALTQ